jgi:hypothetical protein
MFVSKTAPSEGGAKKGKWLAFMAVATAVILGGATVAYACDGGGGGGGGGGDTPEISGSDGGGDSASTDKGDAPDTAAAPGRTRDSGGSGAAQLVCGSAKGGGSEKPGSGSGSAGSAHRVVKKPVRSTQHRNGHGQNRNRAFAAKQGGQGSRCSITPPKALAQD